MEKILRIIGVSLLAGMSLTGCFNKSTQPPKVQPVYLGEVRQWVSVKGEFDVFTRDNTLQDIRIEESGKSVPLTSKGYFELSSGELHVDVASLEFTFVPMGSGPTSFTYIAVDSHGSAAAEVVIDHIASDPLANEQWHLHNTGQTAFSMQPSAFEVWREIAVAQGLSEPQAEGIFSLDSRYLKPGADFNLLGAFAQGVTGEGTISVVVDQGMAVAHEDLKVNVLAGRSINFIANVADRTDTTFTGAQGDHGTSVAGIIAAEGWNQLGGRGVSPGADLIAMNFLGGSSTQTERNRMLSYGMRGSGLVADDPVVSFNRSYGAVVPLFLNADAIDETILRYPTEQLRSGLGALNIKAAGNAYISAPGWPEATRLCDLQQSGVVYEKRRPLSCFDPNWDIENSNFFTLNIGALTSGGFASSYSSAGSSLWVSAPGGEYGDTEPAILTTDQTTCLRGYSSFNAKDTYDQQSRSLYGVDDFFDRAYPFNSPTAGGDQNAQCNYTSSFNGTSAATPMVSGMANLLVSANPELSWRDIRYLLASYAEVVDADDPEVVLSVGDASFVAHHGWVTNAAGYTFNTRYGFGRPDISAAVKHAIRLREERQPLLSDLLETEWVGGQLENLLSVPDNEPQGITIEVQVEEDIVIESLQLALGVYSDDLLAVYNGEHEGSTAASDIAIELTSPAGTTAVVASSRTALGAFDGIGALGGVGYAYHPTGPMLANAFLGERTQGIWKVRVLDTNGEDRGNYLNNQAESVLDHVALRFFGNAEGLLN